MKRGTIAKVNGVMVDVECPVCKVRSSVHCQVVTQDGVLALARGNVYLYCRCGDEGVVAAEVGVSLDSNRPILALTPRPET